MTNQPDDDPAEEVSSPACSRRHSAHHTNRRPAATVPRHSLAISRSNRMRICLC